MKLSTKQKIILKCSVILFLMLVVPGCISTREALKSTSSVEPLELVTEKSYDEAWEASLKALLDSKYTIKSMEKEKGIIITDYKFLKIDDFLMSSTAKMANEYSSSTNNYEISINQDINKNIICVKASIREHMARVGTISVGSNGRLESEILRKIEKNLIK